MDFTGILVFGIIGLLGSMGGIGFLALGRFLEGVPPLGIGALLLWRAWGALRDWAE